MQASACGAFSASHNGSWRRSATSIPGFVERFNCSRLSSRWEESVGSRSSDSRYFGQVVRCFDESLIAWLNRDLDQLTMDDELLIKVLNEVNMYWSILQKTNHLFL